MGVPPTGEPQAAGNYAAKVIYQPEQMSPYTYNNNGNDSSRLHGICHVPSTVLSAFYTLTHHHNCPLWYVLLFPLFYR